MKILLNNSDLNEALSKVSNLGFVPTMGSLHKGHESLIKKSLKMSKKTVVSIFVNPTQFNKKRDYQNYPRNINKDLSILRKLNIDYLFLPKIEHIYNYKKKKKIFLKKKDKILCAKYRKGHFEGVIEVMDRLTGMIRPKRIFMGEKDFQQSNLIKRFVEKKYKSKIILCKTIRNKNKLALSSRNLLLKKKELTKASNLTKNLMLYKKLLINKGDIKKNLISKKKELQKSYKVKIEYLELRSRKNLKNTYNIKNSNLFIAYYINNVRLIDNF